MEVTGVVFRPLPSFSGAGIDAHSQPSVFKPSFLGDSMGAGARFSGESRILGTRDLRVSVKPRKFSGFCDDGHLQYYSTAIRCGGGGALKEKEKELSCKEKKMRKRLKLLKGLSKDISMFSDMGFGLDPDHGLADQVKGKMISEAADLLVGQLQQLKAEKKDMTRQRKEEKAKLKAVRMQHRLECNGNSSSSSESSDGECGGVVDMSRLKSEALSRSLPNESQPVIASMPVQVGTIIESSQSNPLVRGGGSMAEGRGLEVCSSQISGQNCCDTGNCTSVSKVDNLSSNEGNSLVTGESTRKIEVCMGGKCKKSGAELLLEEFQKVVGVEGSVVGCKCMGKCRSAPNVKVLNSIDAIQAEVLDDSVRTPANPLCIGVGLEDVGTIVANFFGGNQKELELAAAS